MRIMEYLKITDSLKKEIEPKLKDYFLGRYYKTETNHYHDNRFIQLETILHDIDIHYEYYKDTLNYTSKENSAVMNIILFGES